MPSAADAPEVASKIIGEVKSYAIPFFERYKQVEDLRHALESTNPMDWFVLTQEQRVMILAGIEHATGSTAKALRLLDDALAERAKDLPKKRYLLEKLRARLANGCPVP